MVECAPTPSEAILEVRNQMFRLQQPDKASIDHCLHGFTEAAGQGYGPIVGGFFMVLARFGDGNDKEAGICPLFHMLLNSPKRTPSVLFETK